jgi:hypothetical protein
MKYLMVDGTTSVREMGFSCANLNQQAVQTIGEVYKRLQIPGIVVSLGLNR